MIKGDELPVVRYIEKRKRETSRMHIQNAAQRMNMIVNEAYRIFGNDDGLTIKRIEELYMKDY